MNPPNGRAASLLHGLRNIPRNARVLMANTPLAWIIYVGVTPDHCYYIAVEKEGFNKEEVRDEENL